MDPKEGSETSANINQTLGIDPKIETVNNGRPSDFNPYFVRFSFVCKIVGWDYVDGIASHYWLDGLE
jgi:hypothetical protein